MSQPPAWRASRAKRLEAAAIGSLAYPLVALLARTYRWRSEGREHFDALDGSCRPYILALWHGRILPAIPVFARRGVVAITSENFDGEWIARLMARFGYEAARGSTSRGGARALVEMRRLMAAGRSTAFTVDGPRGPALRVQPGAVWLAKATGHPILPFHIEADRAWTVNSWDRTLVPKPFSRVALCFAPPRSVRRDVNDAGLEEARVDLERTLLGLVERATRLAHDPN